MGVRWVSSTKRSSTSSTSSRTPRCRRTTRSTPSLWVDFSNANYDPQIGHDLYHRYLSEMVLADQLGYDGLVLNEHHNTPVLHEPGAEPHRGRAHPPDQGLDQRVRHAAQPRLPQPPGRGVRHARRDVGRAAARRLPARHGHGVLGQRRQPGHGPGPVPRVDRHHPAAAGREDGPEQLLGDFYTYRYLNPWPKPMQKPYPECYIVGTGSPETIELAAELGFGYSVVFIPTAAQLQVFDHYRERLAAHGHEATPDKVTIGVIRLRGRERRRRPRRSSCPTSCTSSRTRCAPRPATSTRPAT